MAKGIIEKTKLAACRTAQKIVGKKRLACTPAEKKRLKKNRR